MHAKTSMCNRAEESRARITEECGSAGKKYEPWRTKEEKYVPWSTCMVVLMLQLPIQPLYEGVDGGNKMPSRTDTRNASRCTRRRLRKRNERALPSEALFVWRGNVSDVLVGRRSQRLDHQRSSESPLPPPPPSLPTTEQRREVAKDAEWRKSSFNVYLRGFTAPRGTYKIAVCTSSWKEEDVPRDGPGSISTNATAGSSSSAVAKGGKGDDGGGGRRRLEDVEDLWILTYVLAPHDVSRFLFRVLAFSVCLARSLLSGVLCCGFGVVVLVGSKISRN